MNYEILFIVAFIAFVCIMSTINGKKIYRQKFFKCTRAKKSNDFKGISQCAYEVYGESYPYKYIYNPEKIRLMNKKKELISFIIKDKKLIIGHVALNNKKKLDDICEVSTAFVSPKYRGRGLLNKLSIAALNSSKKYGFRVAYVQAVCTHIYSQKEAKKLGLNECAIMLNNIEPMSFKNLNEEEKRRETLVRCYSYLKKPKCKKFHVAERYKEIIKDIYDSLGIKVQFYDDIGKSKIYQLKSVIDMEYSESGNATINIVESGRDIYDVVIKKLKVLFKDGFKSIILTMKLDDESTVYTCDKFKNSGFIFCGVEPRYFKEDILMLQYVSDSVDFKSINLVSDKGKKMLNYIENEYYRNNERKEANEI